MLSYNIDSPETRSQVRLPTIVGRIESERGTEREREGERERAGERERNAAELSARSSDCRVRVHEEVEGTSCFPRRKIML